ncbi:octopamine receptor beta-2R-like [Oculina patagonica]
MANHTATPTKPLSEAIPLGILGVLITLENLLVCFLVYRFRKLRTFTNGFVVSLALSDVLFGAVLIPVSITDQFNPVNAYLISFILFANVTNLFAVTLDRYLAVMNSLRYSYTMTKYFVKILLATWILPVPLTLLPLAWEIGSTAETVYLFFIVLGVLVPYIFILFAYIKIFREVARQVKNLAKLATYENQAQATKEGKRVSSEARVARVFAIIAGIFVISWMPVFYMTAAGALKRDDMIPQVLPIVSWYTMTAGSLANAAVYAFFKGDFRNAFLRLFHCRTISFRRHCSDEVESGTSLN